MSRIPLALAFLLVATSMRPHVATAQPDPYRVDSLAPGIFALIRRVPTRGASDANVLVIENADDVVVVDANIYPASTRQAIAEIRRRTRKPVRIVINTHWHDDHVLGNAEYRRAFPEVTFIAHPVARDSIVHGVAPSLRANRDTVYLATLRQLHDRLASGRRSNGGPLTASDSASLQGQVALFSFFLRDVQGLEVVPPDLTVADSLVLHRGGRTIVVQWPGRGNTPGDLIVWLPAERILATGDLVVAPVPFGFGSFVDEWPSTLRRLRALPASVIIPGHGDAMRDWEYVDQLIGTMEGLAPAIALALGRGHPVDSVRASPAATHGRARFARGDAFLERAFDAMFVTPLYEAARARRSHASASPPPAADTSSAQRRPAVQGAFVALSVPDLPASIAWYTRMFDMKQVFTVPAMGPIAGGALLEGAGLTVELLQHREARPGTTPAELTHGVAKVGWAVNDFDALVAMLRARGAVLFSEPTQGRPGQRASVMLKDNAGNMLQILGPITPS